MIGRNEYYEYNNKEWATLERYGAWWTEAFARTKRLPSLADTLAEGEDIEKNKASKAKKQKKAFHQMLAEWG